MNAKIPSFMMAQMSETLHMRARLEKSVEEPGGFLLSHVSLEARTGQ